MPLNVRVPLPAGKSIPFDPVALADAAVAAGRVHPANRDAWLLRLARGGTAAAAAVMDLMRMFPADGATRAAWGQVRASGPPDGASDADNELFARLYPTPEQAAQGRPGPEIDRLAAVEVRQGWLSSHAAGPRVAADAQDDDEDQLFEVLYPTNETAAALLERRTRQQARDAARFTQAQNYDNTMRAAGGYGAPGDDGDPADPEGGDDVDPAHEVINHPAIRVTAHDHAHSSYQGGTHRHPHAHSGDASHAPSDVNHLHQLAAADPVAAGIMARAQTRAAAGDPYPAGPDEVLYRELFGDLEIVPGTHRRTSNAPPAFSALDGSFRRDKGTQGDPTDTRRQFFVPPSCR